MGIKFYLNKFAKVDNIEEYSLGTVLALNKEYTNFLESTEGLDPDFPGMDFSGNGKKVSGTNATIAQSRGAKGMEGINNNNNNDGI